MNRIKDFTWIIVGFLIVGYVIYNIAKGSISNYVLKNNAQLTKAVIINERNYMGNQPVKPTFSYSYQFEINNKKYTGNSHDTTLNIGDSVEIKYNKDWPCLNNPVNRKE